MKNSSKLLFSLIIFSIICHQFETVRYNRKNILDALFPFTVGTITDVPERPIEV